MEKLKEELEDILRKSRLKRFLSSIRKVSIIGMSFELKEKAKLKIMSALKYLTSRKPLVLIIDEAQVVLRHEKAQRFLAVLHDTLMPNLICVLMGSIASLRSTLEINEYKPLYGRVEEEIILLPFGEGLARGYLTAGFNECGAVSYTHLTLPTTERV